MKASYLCIPSLGIIGLMIMNRDTKSWVKKDDICVKNELITF